MARRVFYSFHYKPDNWRASQVRNMGVIEGNRPASDNEWEKVTSGGDKAIEKWIAEPDTVPDIDPRALTLVVLSVMVSVPDKDVDVWVIRHVIWPGPVESEAGPLHVPVKSTAAGLGAGLGCVGDWHAVAAAAMRPTNISAKLQNELFGLLVMLPTPHPRAAPQPPLPSKEQVPCRGLSTAAI